MDHQGSPQRVLNLNFQVRGSFWFLICFYLLVLLCGITECCLYGFIAWDVLEFEGRAVCQDAHRGSLGRVVRVGPEALGRPWPCSSLSWKDKPGLHIIPPWNCPGPGAPAPLTWKISGSPETGGMCQTTTPASPISL